MRYRQQAPRGLLLLLVTAIGAGSGCDRPNPDLCLPDPPADPAAYTAQIESARQRRDAWFRSSPESPVPASVREHWEGLQYFPVDPRMRFAGPLIRTSLARPFEIVTTAGDRRPCREVGYFLLDLGAGPEKLPVYELLDQPPEQRGFFVPFTDATTGIRSYPAGRYLDVEEVGRGRYRLDFNLAYNPSCAYGGRFQCPVTPEQNRLRASVEAGETGWVEHEARPTP